MSGAHIREEDLQLCAVGALPEEESAAVEAHAAKCEECGQKLAEARGNAALLAFGAEQEKPALAPKAELMARIMAERELARESGLRPLVGKDRRPLDGWWKWAPAPVVAALVLFAGMEWRENVRLTEELRSANHAAVDLENNQHRLENLLNVLASPATISVKLAATSEGSRVTGLVRFNSQMGVLCYTTELPPLPRDKIYQMWIVPVKGAPINAGIFGEGVHGPKQLWTAEVPLNTEPKAFAVTIEPAGGAPQPTGPKVLLGTS
jgi:anti-sigma-K factor RskA